MGCLHVCDVCCLLSAVCYSSQGPEQGKLHHQGNQYIHDEYPLTDFIQSCRVITTAPGEEGGAKALGGGPQGDLLASAFLSTRNERKARDRSLRSDKKASEADGASLGTMTTSDDGVKARNKAFTAIAVLVVAIGLLLCLYKFSTITEGKSQ